MDKTGLCGDMCPRCWSTGQLKVGMRLLSSTRVHGFTAPKGHNGDIFQAVEWCPKCGSIRQSVDYHGSNTEHIKVFTPEDMEG